MKTVVIMMLSFIVIFSLGSSCGDSPFEYTTNSRIILEGRLLDINNQPLVNQKVSLKSFDVENIVTVTFIISDGNGYFFLSSARGNNSTFLDFEGKDIVSVERNSDLVKQPFGSMDWIGFLNENQYNFGTVVLEDFN